MIEIPLPKSIKIAGFSYKIDHSQQTSKTLQSDGSWGKCRNTPGRVIEIDREASPQQFHNTFLHELIHAVDCLYSNQQMKDEQVAKLANGLHQVFEGLGIRFVMRK